MGIYNRKDFYYKRAKSEGYRSRAAYKLIELNRKYSVIREGDFVADLGCAPGGFLQVASEIAGEKGIVVGVDLVSVAPAGSNVFVIKNDFTNPEVIKEMLGFTGGRRFDVILSDMAPKTTGIQFRDSFLSFRLAEAAYISARELLKSGGNILIKVFEGEELHGLIERLKKSFEFLHLNRPESTRKGSKEIYIIGKQYRSL
ncbi:MAG: RlmE family RNA methyltransferase [Deltaproteobacteria bacterium]|nr:RlmE family RNA methyltransferase [Deltaproteobacteria bacterium]